MSIVYKLLDPGFDSRLIQLNAPGLTLNVTQFKPPIRRIIVHLRKTLENTKIRRLWAHQISTNIFLLIFQVLQKISLDGGFGLPRRVDMALGYDGLTGMYLRCRLSVGRLLQRLSLSSYSIANT